ncbi:hypothetical protein BRCON_1245 [Candidatus Sumerlaea chitinivorans]|uniref:Uncharacterized protein n=1 Tax=Sumerlaea chitinivorans TaxID=2250252 RepID=A0A2Z4Y5P2_SUMC1|nr:hypothetical protein BRCON_1245 [Candidatus Sumerlaea chitinivorans]
MAVLAFGARLALVIASRFAKARENGIGSHAGDLHAEVRKFVTS